MVIHAVGVVAVLVDVADLVDLVAVARVDAADAVGLAKVALVDVEATALGVAFPAPVIVGVAVDVMGVILDVLDVVGNAKVAPGVRDVADLVQAHARHMVKAHLVLHAIVALDVLVHVHHVHHVQDVAGVADVQVDVADVLDVRPAAKVTVLPNVADAPADAIPHVLDVQEDAAGALEDAAGARDAVLDVTVHALEHVMAVVTAAVGNAKTHVLPHAPQHVLEPAKLKHSAP